MRKTFIAVALMAGAVVLAPTVHADDLDCYTEATYGGGSKTTCIGGYPDYARIVTVCDGKGRCTIREY